MESHPIVLPAAPAVPRRIPLPFMAALVPIAAGVALWLITGAVLALCFAALGPLMLGASLADAARTRRRERRQNAEQAERGWADAETELARRHEAERRDLWHRHPDVAVCLSDTPLRGAEPPDVTTLVVVGSGIAASRVRCSGGDDQRARSFRERCSVLVEAPIPVPLAGGVCLRGPRPLVTAAARALVAQLCLRFSAAQLALVGEEVLSCGLGTLAHAKGSPVAAFRLGVGAPGGARLDVDALIWLTGADGEVPEGITTVVDVIEPGDARLRTSHGSVEIAIEGLSRAQAESLGRARTTSGDDARALPEVLHLHELQQPHPGSGLAASVGRSEHGDVTIDIVEDGPHAIVTGMTGTGKSELLVTWVAAIAATHGPERVAFVLVDFKGGTAFEPLRGLPQVAAIVTDLDEEGARRGVSSLTAELRRREGVLAAAGARNVSEIDMPRLVIVVDEFAALLTEHPDLGGVFTDLAARGRALGMHLILGTQRASGVVREALAANCPLRVSLRVRDTVDSKLMIGSEAAATLTGGPETRGLGFVRRPVDSDAVPVRAALTGRTELRRAAQRWADHPRPRSPWLEALPDRIPLAELAASESFDEGSLLLGKADDPARQSQPTVVLRCGADRGIVFVGVSGAGKTAALRTLAAQRADACWVPSDHERAWDLMAGWATGAQPLPALVLCDDVDTLLAGFPSEYAQSFVQSWERVVRTAATTTFAFTVMRPAGMMGRVLETLPRRALLRLSSRVDHLAAGGEASTFQRDRRPGRAHLDDHEVQLAWVDESDAPAEPPAPEAWVPTRSITGIVAADAPALAERMRLARPRCDVALAPSIPDDGASRSIVIADAETWQRNWSIWQRIRTEGEVLIRVEQPGDLRQLAGVRELPPFARMHAGRAWVVRGADAPRRVSLPELAPGPR